MENYFKDQLNGLVEDGLYDRKNQHHRQCLENYLVCKIFGENYDVFLNFIVEMSYTCNKRALC